MATKGFPANQRNKIGPGRVRGIPGFPEGNLGCIEGMGKETESVIEQVNRMCYTSQTEESMGKMKYMDYAVGNGWRPLVDEATARLDKIGVKVINHFEKYGTLRFTTDTEPLEATIILNEMEDRSKGICESCRATGDEVDQVEFSGWIKTLCPACFKHWKEKHGFSILEHCMEQHQFLEADKKKVRDFLREHQAIKAYMTKNELHYIDKNGVPGIVGRSLIGIQDNFY